MDPLPPSGSGPPASPSPNSGSLPVVDVIGLRFSLAQLRLVGYGLLGFWLVELAMALSAPDAGAIGSRL